MGSRTGADTATRVRTASKSSNTAEGAEAPGLRQLLAGLTAVRDGDFGTRLPEDGDGLLGEIATVFNGMVDQLSLFTSEVTRVAREVGTEGRLGGQAEVPGVSGTWKDLTDSVNAMAGNLTTQVRDIAQVATAVARGDLSQKIDVAARGEILELKNTLNTMVDQLSSFAAEVTRVAREVGTEGMLGGQAQVPGVGGTWRDLTDSVNFMAGNLTAQVRSIAQVATAVAKGDLTRTIDVAARGEILELKNTLNTMVEQLSAFADEVTRVAREVGTEGNLGGQATVRGVSGTWKDLTDNVNVMASNLTGQVRSIAQVTTAVAQGDLTKKIDVDARGEILELKTTINTMVDQLSSFAAEVTRVAREVGSEGRLGGQAEVEGVSGTWKRLTENVNELAGNLTRQVRAIAEVTSAVAEGDLTRSITVDASGEVADLKDNINSMVKSLRETTRANRDQDWLKSNLARISALMQGRRDLAVVADLIMDELTPLVGAQYGAFFLAEEAVDGIELGLIGSYGSPGGRQTRFRLGQSLVGQAARSRRTIAVDGVPAHYVAIASGLGRTAPASLIVLPIVVEGQVLGVIELASVHPFTPVHRAFLEQLMETVGVNVNTIVANSRTDELLGESQRLTRELEARAQQLALASKYKSEFLANMSHELRTPLNSLLILAQLLAQNPTRNLTPKQVEYAGVIHSAGSDLLQLINDILDLSKVEAGKMDVDPERVSLRRLLEYVEATFHPLTTQKGLEFRVRTATGVPGELLTDDSRLRQVLRNLLSNAVKFTETGSVELSIEPARAEELPPAARRDGPALAFRVRDTGIGIPEQQLETIFGAFQQADGTTSRKYGGTGLGLSISREIAQLLGGAITARSTAGEGSTFTLYLPIEHPDWLALEQSDSSADDRGSRNAQATGSPEPSGNRQSSATAPDPDRDAAIAPRRLLVIEDRPRGLLSLIAENAVADLADSRNLLGPHDPVRIRTAVGAQEAAAELAAEPYHCVVLELDMADDGAARFLRARSDDPALREIPVLAHHNRRLGAARERLLQMHAQSCPLELLPSLDELRERIALHLTADRPDDVLPLARPENRQPAELPQNDGRLTGRTVLVVDDDARNVFALTGMLEFHGMRVLNAENGVMGIDVLNGDPSIELILMDVMMPEMDGYEATALIRATPDRAGLPIISVTAKAMQGDREKSLAAGASEYVTKPVDAAVLIDCIQRVLNV